jgi:hypothetical protein
MSSMSEHSVVAVILQISCMPQWITRAIFESGVNMCTMVEHTNILPGLLILNSLWRTLTTIHRTSPLTRIVGEGSFDIRGLLYAFIRNLQISYPSTQDPRSSSSSD